MKTDEYYIEIAYKEAQKACDKNEIPVGAVIVSINDGKIISKAHNLRDSTNITTRHAEIIAIEKANKIKNNWRLNDCIIYTTLKPCNMCMEVINNSKIKKVIYAAEPNCQITQQICEIKQIEEKNIIKKCSILMQESFKNIRKNKKKQDVEKDVSRETLNKKKRRRSIIVTKNISREIKWNSKRNNKISGKDVSRETLNKKTKKKYNSNRKYFPGNKML